MQGEDPLQRHGWSPGPAPPLIQGEAAAGPGPHQPLTPPATPRLHHSDASCPSSTAKSGNGHTQGVWSNVLGVNKRDDVLSIQTQVPGTHAGDTIWVYVHYILYARGCLCAYTFVVTQLPDLPWGPWVYVGAICQDMHMCPRV